MANLDRVCDDVCDDVCDEIRVGRSPLQVQLRSIANALENCNRECNIVFIIAFALDSRWRNAITIGT
jgi:hypothetical protein